MTIKNFVVPSLVATATFFASACGIISNNNPTTEADSSTAEELLFTTATDDELEALGLASKKKQPLAQKAGESIAKNQAKSANTQKRAANVETALAKLREVRAKPTRGLMQAKDKCDSIAAGVAFLKSTNSPKRPFDGLRNRFRVALKAERDSVLKVNGFTSCGKVRNAVASLPPAAPAPETLADEAVPATDALDEVVLAPSEI